MDVVHFQTHTCDHCQKVIFDLRDEFERSARAVSDLNDQLERGAFGVNPKSENNPKDETNMAERGELFNVSFDEFGTGAAAGCQLFNWIMDDEWISLETIHSLARKDMPIGDPNDKLGWTFRDSSLWIERWLGEPRPENTLHKDSAQRRRLLRPISSVGFNVSRHRKPA